MASAPGRSWLRGVTGNSYFLFHWSGLLVKSPRNHIVLCRICLSRYTPSFPRSSLVYASIEWGGPDLSSTQVTPCLLLKHTSTALTARRYRFVTTPTRMFPARAAPNYPSWTLSSIGGWCPSSVLGCGCRESPPSRVGSRLPSVPFLCIGLRSPGTQTIPSVWVGLRPVGSPLHRVSGCGSRQSLPSRVGLRSTNRRRLAPTPTRKRLACVPRTIRRRDSGP